MWWLAAEPAIKAVKGKVITAKATAPKKRHAKASMKSDTTTSAKRHRALPEVAEPSKENSQEEGSEDEESFSNDEVVNPGVALQSSELVPYDATDPKARGSFSAQATEVTPRKAVLSFTSSRIANQTFRRSILCRLLGTRRMVFW